MNIDIKRLKQEIRFHRIKGLSYAKIGQFYGLSRQVVHGLIIRDQKTIRNRIKPKKNIV